MDPIAFTPIGVVHSPYTQIAGMPIQTVAARGISGMVVVDEAYAAGLRDIDGFLHLWLLVHLHRMQGFALEVIPYMDDKPHGVFATRSPRRPNPIGLSLVRLVRVEGATLHIEDIDLLDGTPVLDIKPYVPKLDDRASERTGWFAANVHKVSQVRADGRFV
jgi:tRNA-Thr(GGU) m(6)t(6)A37 methyltransferase TsaA